MAVMDINCFRDRIAGGTLSRRELLEVLASVGVVTVTIPVAAAQSRPLEVFTWPGYEAARLRPGFGDNAEAEPDFLLYADNDEAYRKVASGFRPSLAQPTNHMIGLWRETGVLKAIDTSRLSNYGDLLPELAAMPQLQHGGETLAVPFAWGNASVIYRKDLAEDYNANPTWEILWDPAFSGRLIQRDSMDAAVLTAAMVLGIEDPYAMGTAEQERVREKLVEQRELLRFYWNARSEVEQGLATGELIAAYGWNASFAALKRNGIDVGFMNPAEGILTWVDCTCLIADGPGEEEEAYAYIDAGISAQAGAFLIETFGYGAASALAFQETNPTLLAELGMEQPGEILKNSRFFQAWPENTRDQATLMFEEIKSAL